MSFRIGEVPEGHLRSLAATDQFSNENGLRFWTKARNAFIAGIPDRRVLDFARILDEEHREATLRTVPPWILSDGYRSTPPERA